MNSVSGIKEDPWDVWTFGCAIKKNCIVGKRVTRDFFWNTWLPTAPYSDIQFQNTRCSYCSITLEIDFSKARQKTKARNYWVWAAFSFRLCFCWGCIGFLRKAGTWGHLRLNVSSIPIYCIEFLQELKNALNFLFIKRVPKKSRVRVFWKHLKRQSACQWRNKRSTET